MGRASKEEWGLDFWFDKAPRLTIKEFGYLFLSIGETAGGPGKEREVGMVETSSLLITAVKTLEMLSIGQQPLF